MIVSLCLSSFSMGFCLAVALICRVTIRPESKKILKSLGMIKERQARIPKPREVLDSEDDQIIL